MIIERKILIGMITSSAFLKKIQSIWKPGLLESSLANIVAPWCIDYYKKYHKAPQKDIETIYYANLKAGMLPPDTADLIENDLLPGLSEEYTQTKDNKYLFDETFQYLRERHLQVHQEKISTLVEEGEIEQADKLILEYTPITSYEENNELNLQDKETLNRVKLAFDETNEPVIYYPGALGTFWNTQLVRGSFIGLLAPEKRGKTFWLLDMALRASKQGMNVAFFQAGDMTENQWLMRGGMYLAQKPIKEKYSGKYYQAVVDCVKNQLDVCEKSERASDFGVFIDTEEQKLREEITKEELEDAYKENKGYKACRNCLESKNKQWGAPWIKVKKANLLTKQEAIKIFRKFFMLKKRSFKLLTYMNGTLTLPLIINRLTLWEKEGFYPDLIIIDYADLIESSLKEHRHKQDQIWKGLRGVSQRVWGNGKQSLVVTATQADAKSYEQNWLKLSNFSEDKRKYAHVTAMYGLNQDKHGREKKIGVMRLNELVVREDEFIPGNYVNVIQDLRIGRPFIASYK